MRARDRGNRPAAPGRRRRRGGEQPIAPGARPARAVGRVQGLLSRARAVHRQRRDDRARCRAALPAGDAARRIYREAALGSGGVAFLAPSLDSVPAAKRLMFSRWRHTMSTVITTTAQIVAFSSPMNQAKNT